MGNQNQPLSLQAQPKTSNQATALRFVWLLLTLFVVGLVVAATPLRYQMLQSDVYGYQDGLLAVGLSLSFFAAYFTFWELVVVGGSLLVAILIAWKRSDDWFAMLVAISMTLFAMLLPLVDGLSYANPQLTVPIVILRQIEMGCIMAVMCLFPNGRFSPSWTRWLLLFYCLFFLAVFIYNPLVMAETAVLPNTRTIEDALWVLLGVTWFGAAILGQIVRYRKHATPLEKQQMKWVLFGFALMILFSLISVVLLIAFPQLNNDPGSRTRFTLIMGGFYLLTALTLPAALTLSILRFRLWDVDILINRTLVYGGLTAIIILIYMVLVGGLSLLLQAQNNLLISLLATGLIAVLFQPLRERLQRTANRLMFGERDDPYGVLSRLGRQLQETAVPAQSLPAVVSTITQTLKLPYAAIELVAEGGKRQSSAVSGQPTAVVEEWPLIYQGVTVGWLSVAPRAPGESFSSRELQLLEDIAAQAGAAAYSVRLTNALQKSRERLVLAREEERRRIRRDLHDELGPSLASQTFKLDAAIDVLESDPHEAALLLESLKEQNQALVGDIRRLVYELRPPALDELGLMGALKAHVDQIDAPQVILTAIPDPLPALPAAVEVAAYRIVLEAVTNVVRHASAHYCHVRLHVEKNSSSSLCIDIVDDGSGLPQELHTGVGMSSMVERAEELGGSLTIETQAQGGIRVTASLPLGGQTIYE